MPTTDPELLRRRARLAETVRRLREDHGWTQEELAHQAGFDRKSVNRLENAAYSPTVDRLFLLAAPSASPPPTSSPRPSPRPDVVPGAPPDPPATRAAAAAAGQLFPKALSRAGSRAIGSNLLAFGAAPYSAQAAATARASRAVAAGRFRVIAPPCRQAHRGTSGQCRVPEPEETMTSRRAHDEPPTGPADPDDESASGAGPAQPANGTGRAHLPPLEPDRDDAPEYTDTRFALDALFSLIRFRSAAARFAVPSRPVVPFLLSRASTARSSPTT